MRRWILCSALLFWSTALTASCGADNMFDNITRFRTLFIDPPTLECIGVRWYIFGDDNGNAKGHMRFREKGGGPWRDALPLLRVNREVANRDFSPYASENLLAGSIFGLTPDTAYEVGVTITDPDGGEADTTFVVTTRAVPVAPAPLRTLHLQTNDTGGDGIFTDFAALAAALKPGDLVLVHDGLHMVGRDGITFSTGGTPEHPIVIRGADDGPATIASDYDITLFDLRNADNVWFERLRIRTGDIPVEQVRERVSEANDTFHLQHMFFADGTRGLVVRNCELMNVRMGFYSYSERSENWYIADNVITGRNENWYPRGHDNPSHTAVNLYGRGHVVCHNRISGFWDCIAIANYDKPPHDLALQCVAIDFYRNDLSESVDDAIEADYGCHNIRVFENRIVNTHTGLSAQPTYGGPIYFVRNVVYNATSLSLKLHNWCTGLEIYHNTLISARQGFYSYPRWQNAKIFNNLFIASSRYAAETGSPHPATTLDYNGWRKPEDDIFIKWDDGDGYERYDSLAAFTQATGYEAHGVMADYGCFVNIEAPQEGSTYSTAFGDPSLAASCPAVDSGVLLPTINDGYTGNGPDIGALERGVSPPQYGPRP